ncbi:MAG: molybdopterin-dependent oxidoreductase [Acidimicrobiales bacterium]|nr:molybdopterin-dependent oxidoreductase [Acidimicrobiales bacterium]
MASPDGRVRTACPLDCPDTCSLEVLVEGGRLVRVDAAPPGADTSPLTQGFICQKVMHHARRVYAPERVRTPLVRTGPKGSGELRAASWDEALDLVVARLREAAERDGPESVVPYTYNSSGGVLAQEGLGGRFWHRFGASLVQHTICAATAGAAWALTYGDMLSADPLDVVHARLVVVWGANPTVSNVHLPPLVRRAQDAGARLVVVDPRRTGMARRADLHLAVRPGTDVVVALAAARHLAHEGLLDDAFLAEHATGVEAFLDAAEPWTLERASAVAGVAAAAIATLAEWYAATRPAMLRLGWGLERNRNGGAAVRAVLALPVLAGQLGGLGGGVLGSTGRGSPWGLGQRDPGVAPGRPPRRRLNMNRLGADLTDPALDPPVAVLFVQGANPAVMNPDQGAVLAGLARDDLFTVVHDQVLTDTACFADVVLPATTHFEVDDAADSYGGYTLQPIRPVIDRVGESRTNDEVIAALAERLGYPADTYDPSPQRLLRDGLGGAAPGDVGPVLRPAGTTVQLRDTFPGFPDRRARLAHPGLDGVDEVPRYRELPVERTGPFPLTLVSPATHRTVNSIFGEVQPAAAVVALHPADAAARSVADGDRVRVWNDQAEVILSARVDADLRPGVCSIPKGLWRRHVAGGLTANALVPADVSDLAGGACFNDARVEVQRA